ncbi:MAG: 2-dehydropantoate 2-reductase [Paenisporosarcina sp.]
MKICIIGAGSIGLLLGSYFSEMGHDVYMFARREEQVKALKDKGITRIMPNQQEVNVSVYATHDVKELPKNAWWFIAVKSHHLTQLTSLLNEVSPETKLVFVQNGLAHIKWLEKLQHIHSYIGTIEHGAMKQDSTTVLHKGFGVLNLAALEEDNQKYTEVFQSENVNFPIRSGFDAFTLVLRKTILNACINPLTAILNVPNGGLIHDSYSFSLMKKIFEEIMDAFPEMRSHLLFTDVKKLCEKTAENRSSMLQDIQHGTKTEIDSIVGALIEQAAIRHKVLPTLQTLYTLVRAKEESGAKHA